MGDNSRKIRIVVTIVIIFVILAMMPNEEESRPKCSKVGCDNKQIPGKHFCYDHIPVREYTTLYSYPADSDSENAVEEINTIEDTTKFSDVNDIKAQETIKQYSNTTKAQETIKSYSSTTKAKEKNKSYSNTSKKNTYGNSTTKKTYESYDDGYDDIYMDGDYDDDRYNSDSDYADGVDDAMDEFEGDW